MTGLLSNKSSSFYHHYLFWCFRKVWTFLASNVFPCCPNMAQCQEHWKACLLTKIGAVWPWRSPWCNIANHHNFWQVQILLKKELQSLVFVRNFNYFAVVVAVIAFCAEFQLFCCGCCCYCFCWHASIAKFNVWKTAKISKISNCAPRSLVYQTNLREGRPLSNREHTSRDEKLDKYQKWFQSKKLFFR